MRASKLKMLKWETSHGIIADNVLYRDKTGTQWMSWTSINIKEVKPDSLPLLLGSGFLWACKPSGPRPKAPWLRRIRGPAPCSAPLGCNKTIHILKSHLWKGRLLSFLICDQEGKTRKHYLSVLLADLCAICHLCDDDSAVSVPSNHSPVVHQVVRLRIPWIG